MMPTRQTVLLVGGTGRTGRLVLEQLLGRGVQVRAIVRSRARLPGRLAGLPGLVVCEADLLSLGEAELLAQVRGCDAILSCLGHTINFKGIFGPPRDLVTSATRRLCHAVRASLPDRPVRFVLMSSVSVNHPAVREPRRGAVERAVLSVLRGAVPPARDNQRAADFLCREIGRHDPHVEWVVVRPDTLLHGEASPYALHEELVNSLAKPGSTSMANVARFMCDLAGSEETWRAWAGKLPVIINAPLQRPAASGIVAQRGAGARPTPA